MTEDLLIKKTRVKDSTGMRVSSDFYKELDNKLREMMTEAEERAKGNDRKTVQKHDL